MVGRLATKIFDIIRPVKSVEKRPIVSFNYRNVLSRVPRWNNFLADSLQCAAYTWLLWHFYFQFEHVIGVKFPDPASWTDEELGIPPIVIEDE